MVDRPIDLPAGAGAMDDGIEVVWITAAGGTAVIVGMVEIEADGSTAVGIPAGVMIELWIGAAG